MSHLVSGSTVSRWLQEIHAIIFFFFFFGQAVYINESKCPAYWTLNKTHDVLRYLEEKMFFFRKIIFVQRDLRRWCTVDESWTSIL